MRFEQRKGNVTLKARRRQTAVIQNTSMNGDEKVRRVLLTRLSVKIPPNTVETTRAYQ